MQALLMEEDVDLVAQHVLGTVRALSLPASASLKRCVRNGLLCEARIYAALPRSPFYCSAILPDYCVLKPGTKREVFLKCRGRPTAPKVSLSKAEVQNISL